MIALSLAEVADAVGGRLEPAGSDGLVVTGPVVVDSRLAGPGSLFVALPGERVDGHAFVDAARAAGAVATLSTRPVPGPHVVVPDAVISLGRLARAVVDRLVLQRNQQTGHDGDLHVIGQLDVIGLTGSSGKTGTKDLLGQVLATAGPTVAPEGNFNNEIGLPLTALAADEQTRYLVLEMGARGPGHIRYLAGIAPPRIALVLNVGSAHASEFGSLRDTARAKSELVQALPEAEHGGVAVLNADDPLVAGMAAVTGARVVTFGVAGGPGGHADVQATDVALDALGRPSFTAVAGGARAAVRLQVHGGHQVSNALGVLAVALAAGLGVHDAAAALSAAVPRSRWRMEVTERPDGVTVVNDAYNANPESMAAGLTALTAMGHAEGGPRRRTWAVLGEMLELGAASDDQHRDIGRLARRLGTDRLVVVGAGARTIHDGALGAGAQDGDDAVLVADSEAALAVLRAELRPGDVVLLKSSRDAGLRWLGDVVAGQLDSLPGDALPGDALPGDALPGDSPPGESLSGNAS